MCRHLAYLGTPVPLARLLYQPEHGLARQSWAPRDMRGGGTINADGFGVGWYPETPAAGDNVAGVSAAGIPAAGVSAAGIPAAGDPAAGGAALPNGSGPGMPAAPLRYRSDRPLWADPDLPAIAAVTRSGAVLASIRSATEGMPVLYTAVAPFAEGRWLFSHNGRVLGWPDSVAGLAAALPVRDLLTLPAPTDAALLWALVRDRLRRGADPADALAETVTEVASVAPGSRLNLLLTDGNTAVATTYGHALSVWTGDGAVLLSSEPLDDDQRWRPVPQGHLIVATATTTRQSPLPVGDRLDRRPAPERRP